jgi:hypothetical protein
MSAAPEIPRLERVAFFDGQRLTAADLAAVVSYQRELRWLHNRSLHTWGIGMGLGVAGEADDRQVSIAPGYGIDCLGREIVLTQARVEPVPPVAGTADGGEETYYLTASYAEDADLEVVETREGVCQGSGAVRRSERPRLAWCKPGDVERGYALILAQIWVRNCRLSRPVSLDPRRSARPAHQPYIAAGRTDASATVWSFWPENALQASARGVETTVDTSGARFRLTPRYFATVAGSRVLAPESGQEGPEPLVDGFAAVVAPGPASFKLQVLMPRDVRVSDTHTLNPAAVFTDRTLDRLQEELSWHVVWIGIEG